MNYLVDLIPAKYRKYLYAALSAALSIYAIWQAVSGDIGQFILGATTALVNVLAAANTDTEPKEEDHLY